MKLITKLTGIILLLQFLTGCLAAGAVAGSVIAPILAQRVVAKQSEVKPPKYIDIEQQGRIITASFEVKSFLLGNKQTSQMRGFHQWATAAVVSEAEKRGCVNVINAISTNQGTTAESTIGSVKLGSSVKFKCLDKETSVSEQDLLEDKKVIYAEQLNYIAENPEMIRYK